MRRLIPILVAVALTAPLGACGKKSDPGPPPGTETEYPRTYPPK